MTRKIYESDRLVSNLTVFVKGRPRRLNFVPVSAYVVHNDASIKGTYSRLETNDPALQTALEHCPAFGSTFRLAQVIQTEDPKPKLKPKPALVPAEEKVAEPTPVKEEVETAPAAPTPAPAEGKNLKVIQVSSPADARDYLNKEYGIQPKSVFSVALIKKKATELGIEFEGI